MHDPNYLKKLNAMIAQLRAARDDGILDVESFHRTHNKAYNAEHEQTTLAGYL